MYRNLFGRTAATFFEKSENTGSEAEEEEEEEEVESGAVELSGGIICELCSIGMC